MSQTRARHYLARPTTPVLVLLVLFCAAPGLTACASARRTQGGAARAEPRSHELASRPGERGDQRAGEEAPQAGERAGLERALAGAHRALDATRLDVELAGMSAAAELAAAEEAVNAAAFKRDEARAAATRFVQFERPLRLRRAERAVTQAENQLIAKRADFTGIQAIYAQEPEAMAKEEILRRSEQEVVAAEEGLALANLELQLLGDQLPSEERELDRKVEAQAEEWRAKERALERAKLQARKSELDAQNKHLDAQDAVRKAEEALADSAAEAAE